MRDVLAHLAGSTTDLLTGSAYEWDGDPTPYMVSWLSGRPFAWPASPLVE